MSIAFSLDGQRIVTASEDRTARVWKADGGRADSLCGHEAYVFSAAFSPDGQSIVTTSGDGTAWSVEGGWKRRAGSAARVMRSTSRRPPSARTASDRHRLGDGMARVWKVDGSGEPVVLRGHEEYVTSAAFSPDGQSIVTASFDTTARVWKADGGKNRWCCGVMRAASISAAFSPDGQQHCHRLLRHHGAGVASCHSRTSTPATTGQHRLALSPEPRRTYLDESEDQAQERYEACERSHGRKPFFTATP